MQINLVTTPPHKATLMNKEDIQSGIWVGNMVNMRANPYPPSFRRMAAKIIDPAIGAST